MDEHLPDGLRLTAPFEDLALLLAAGRPARDLLGSIPAEDVVAALEGALDAAARAGTDVDPAPAEAGRQRILALADAGRWPEFLRKIYGTRLEAQWLTAVLRGIDQCDFHLGDLLRLRARQDPDRVAVCVCGDQAPVEVTREELRERAEAIAAGLRVVLPALARRVEVAILAPNRLETIVTDLACLAHGIVNVPIAADATPDQIRFILEATAPALLVVADEKRLEAVLSAGPLPFLQEIILLDPPEEGSSRTGFRLLEEIESLGRAALAAQDRVAVHGVRRGVRVGDMASLLFTSGTTGRPKGIRFSQRSIMYKRYCRAAAIPEIGEDDVFLCYLPLYHTFGRWFEMTGTLFWGARYVAMPNPSADAVLENMRTNRPTVFISIPKRWIQIHEKAQEAAQRIEERGMAGEIGPPPQAGAGGTTTGDKAAIARAALAEVTGGRLRWGLSAAGYLDPEIFQYFQRNGVELLSGFGMTEATGGITMTPPGGYRKGTVGVALPGVEVMRAEDGELLVRGPYMMLGYDDPDEPERDYEKEWFATGDLVSVDGDGYVTIVDRKKDIYKNVKGQTIAPQRIENMFNEFEEILRSFLVGDGREYNTLLIYPNYELGAGKLARMSAEDLRDYLSSFVVGVNRFLAPFERVVDFQVLPRFFSEERGELTPKGTFVRKMVEQNFKEIVEGLYARPYVSVEAQGIEVRVPTWLLRDKGSTSEGLFADATGIRIRSTGDRLAIARIGSGWGRYRIGSFHYAIDRGPGPARPGGAPALVDLDTLLRAPRLWVGNAELVRFVGDGLFRRPRRTGESPERMAIEGWQRPSIAVADEVRRAFAGAHRRGESGIGALHAAAAMVLATRTDEALQGLDALDRFLVSPATETGSLARELLPLLRYHGDAAVRRGAIARLLPSETDERAGDLLRRFLAVDPDLLDESLRATIAAIEMPAAATRSVFALTEEQDAEAATRDAAARSRLRSLVCLVGAIGARQPRWYAQARQTIARHAIPIRDGDVAALAASQKTRLEETFRTWVASGATAVAAGDAVPWSRIVGFDDRVEPALAERVLRAFAETDLLRETLFLLADGVLLGPADWLPGGVWISRLGAGHGKTVLRATVRTANLRSCDFVIKVATGIAPEEMAQEADWMVRVGTAERGVPLVPDFGGFWPEYQIWTEEYVSGETVLRQIEKLALPGRTERVQRIAYQWPHIAWSALTAFIEFWQRSARRVIVSEPKPNNIVVAPHDYQEGSRLVSVSSRVPFEGVARMLRFYFEEFVGAVEEMAPGLRAIVERRTACAAFVEALGETDAITLLWRAASESRDLAANAPGSGGDPAWAAWHADIVAFVEELEKTGFAPRRLVMAVRRYHAWAGLNPEASLAARARTLLELYGTYGLDRMESAQPDLRVRFFRMTVFADARGPLARELDALIAQHRDAPLGLEALLRRMTIFHRTVRLTEEETYFLARMTYAHLRPSQQVHLELVEEGGETKTELVEEYGDDEAGRFFVRGAASPKEVMRLHRHFEQSGLSVVFRPEHRFLVALDHEGGVIGGLFYRPEGRGIAHMEKIVVAPSHRGRNVGERLMESFLQRMRDAGQRRVTTGYFRPHYFYQFGFRLERGFAGLVRDLEESTP